MNLYGSTSIQVAEGGRWRLEASMRIYLQEAIAARVAACRRAARVDRVRAKPGDTLSVRRRAMRKDAVSRARATARLSAWRAAIVAIVAADVVAASCHSCR